MPWFVKIEEGIVDKTIFDRHVAAHKAFVKALIDKGHEARTGYWANYGGGMLLFKATSMDQAKAIVAQDPLVQSSCVHYQPGQTHTKVHISTSANSDCFIANGFINQCLLRNVLTTLALYKSKLCYP